MTRTHRNTEVFFVYRRNMCCFFVVQGKDVDLKIIHGLNWLNLLCSRIAVNALIRF